ncbi:Voltage-gated hydrogen channel 1 [Psilocybe cubensis]|uniref:Voltage-gated hydrogen channel 1 n=2 Tax=Psilocybe cubensis TaxID=181762 RepID=A0ACB8H996_PSICU|nr:Voltage-gated hydrogen channel 1 [Psilocybe cubensis]KAH9484237.1 Voltage-gated hydrogen channel 1 [Psilocybe cubensis]
MSEQQPLLPAHNSPYDDRGESESQGDKGRLTEFRTKTAHVLEHPTLHKVVITLITVDAICVLADLAYSFLSPTCAPPGEGDNPEWLEVLSHISLAITTLFLIEIPLNLWAFGPQHINPFGPVPHAGLHAFDSIIILTTFVLEVILRGKERELAGLLVILRLWRLVKLVGGVAVGAGELEEETAKELEEMKAELDKVRAELNDTLKENAILKARLQQIQE